MDNPRHGHWTRRILIYPNASIIQAISAIALETLNNPLQVALANQQQARIIPPNYESQIPCISTVVNINTKLS